MMKLYGRASRRRLQARGYNVEKLEQRRRDHRAAATFWWGFILGIAMTEFFWAYMLCLI